MICFDSNTFCVYDLRVRCNGGEGRGVSLKIIIITDRGKFVSWSTSMSRTLPTLVLYRIRAPIIGPLRESRASTFLDQ